MGKLVRVVLVVMLAASLAACSSSDVPDASAGGTTTPPPSPTYGGSVVVGTIGEVDGLNPLTSQWSGPGYQMGRAVLDPLVVMDAEGQWRPYLAKAITPNEDFTVWTFELRPDIEFHNGEKLDAAALAEFFTAAIGSPLSSQGFPEKPAVAVTEEGRVTLTFTEPWSSMPTALVEQTGYVIAPEQIRSGDASHPIGTGPFVFDEWVPGTSFRATRNPSYWRDGLPYLDAIEFRPMADPTARLDGLRAGNVDIVEANSQGEPVLDELRADGLSVVDDFDNTGVANLLMNTQRAPVDDLRVRQAIVAAIDREEFRDTVLDPSFELADQPYRPGNRWHAEIDYPAHDPERARRLVEEYEAEKGPIRITIMSNTTAGPNVSGQYLQQQLDAVGIETTLETLELASFVKRFVQGDYDTVFLGAFFGAADPDGSYPFLISTGAAPETLIKLNFSRLQSPEIDAALSAQRATDDDEVRKEAWTSIWEEMATELPYAFLVHDRTAWATAADIHGLDDATTPEGVPLPAINRWTPFFTSVHRST